MDLGSCYSVIKRLLLTEKSNREVAFGKYSFEVARGANKIQIAKAVEKIYKVKVKKITAQTVKGRAKKIKWDQPGKTSSWKKAVVTLEAGQEIKTS